jgi:hypothetical protein
LIGSVSGIDDGDIGYFGGVAGSSFQKMPHNDYVGIVGNHFNGVSEGFSFGGTGCGRIGKTDYASSEPVDGSFETETGAGGWFKKQSRGYFALQNVLIGI